MANKEILVCVPLNLSMPNQAVLCLLPGWLMPVHIHNPLKVRGWVSLSKLPKEIMSPSRELSLERLDSKVGVLTNCLTCLTNQMVLLFL